MIASLAIPHLRPLLSKGLALGLAGLLAACGGGSHSPRPGSPPPTPPGPTPGVTYEVIALNPRGELYGYVEPKGINALGMVAGHNFYNIPEGSRAFRYDGTRVIELGTFGGANSRALGINRCGHVTGWAETSDGVARAFLYDGILRDIGSLSGSGHAINDCGIITGVAEVPGGGFVYDGTLRAIGTLPGGSYSYPSDINAHGVVAGLADVPGGEGVPGGAVHAFIYDSKAGTGLQDLGTLGGVRSGARFINDAGQVAGWAFNAAGATRAFRYSGGVMQDLGTIGGTGTTEAVGMNAAGLVIGNWLDQESGERRGFIHDGTTLRDLGSHTEAVAINASGQVVGAYAAPDQRAMSWTAEGGLVDLNSRLHQPPAGLRVLRAMAISDNGAIVAHSNTGLVLLKVRR